jgi:uncharacterized protein (DUF58 family)
VKTGPIARSLLRNAMTIGRGILIAFNPLQWRRAAHRVATPSSAICLLALISSLNFVWGYPWVGLFAAMISIFVVGWGINRIMAPRFNKITVDAPRWIPAGSQAIVRLGVHNARSIPAIDLSFELSKPKPTRSVRTTTQAVHKSTQDARHCEMIAPGAVYRWECLTDWPRRGMHPVPSLIVQSFFPFHLFRNRHTVDLATLVAVAPRPLDHDEHPALDSIMATISGLIQRWKSGDSMVYLGSREYQVGMTVRRWDFASWARLGKPIVREFGTTSTASIRLIIDTAIDAKSGTQNSSGDTDSLERLLSLAVLVIETILQRSFAIDLLVTYPKSIARPGAAHAGDVSDDQWNQAAHAEPRGDLADVMIRLAIAAPTTAQQADERLAKWKEDLASNPTLVLSRRSMPEDDPADSTGDFVWIAINDSVHQSSAADLDRSNSSARDQRRSGVFA